MKHSAHESPGSGDLVGFCTSSGLDALAILGYVVVVDFAILVAGTPQALRALVAIPLVVLLPGYAVTAALFPRTVDRFRTDERNNPFQSAVDGALSPAERVATSFGASIAMLPVLGVVHSVADLGFDAPSLLGTLTLVVVLALGVGLLRRVRVPRRERVTFSPGTWPTAVKTRLLQESRLDTVLTVGLVVVVLAASTGLGLALVAPNSGESYSTMKLLTENETGALVMSDYPTELAAGESASFVLGVENHERSRTSYTVVTEIQRVRATNGTTSVLEGRELGQRSRTVPAGDTWYAEHTVSPMSGGESQRIVYLLYRGDPPADPRIANAYEYLHFTVNVTGT